MNGDTVVRSTGGCHSIRASNWGKKAHLYASGAAVDSDPPVTWYPAIARAASLDMLARLGLCTRPAPLSSEDDDPNTRKRLIKQRKLRPFGKDTRGYAAHKRLHEAV